MGKQINIEFEMSQSGKVKAYITPREICANGIALDHPQEVVEEIERSEYKKELCDTIGLFPKWWDDLTENQKISKVKIHIWQQQKQFDKVEK